MRAAKVNGLKSVSLLLNKRANPDARLPHLVCARGSWHVSSFPRRRTCIRVPLQRSDSCATPDLRERAPVLRTRQR
jgi:hypothetical protein